MRKRYWGVRIHGAKLNNQELPNVPSFTVETSDDGIEKDGAECGRNHLAEYCKSRGAHVSKLRASQVDATRVIAECAALDVLAEDGWVTGEPIAEGGGTTLQPYLERIPPDLDLGYVRVWKFDPTLKNAGAQ